MRLVSVIVATYNRPDDLRECLTAILSNTYPVHEVLVMDQSTNTESKELADSLGDNRLRYFHLESKGKSRALNVAIRAAKGEILCFTDDDCVPVAAWAQEIVGEFEGDPDIQVVFGQTLPKLISSNAAVYATTVASERRVFVRRRSPYNVGGAGGNCAFRREAIDKIGFFDEILGPGSPFKALEDNEYFYRTFKLGMKGVYSPGVTVYHKQHLDKSGVSKRLQEYAMGEGAFVAKYLLKMDSTPLALYLAREAKRVKDALLSRNLPYLKFNVKRFRSTVVGATAYTGWRFEHFLKPRFRPWRMEEPDVS